MTGRVRSRLGAAALAVLATLLVSPRALDAKPPVTSYVGFLGFRQNVGSRLSDSYPSGLLYGAEGGLQPGLLGVAWSILGGWFPAANDQVLESDLWIVQTGIDLRARVGLGGEDARIFALADLGGDLMRTSTPLPGRDDQSYLGWSAGLGLEFLIGDWLLIAMSGDYGAHVSGTGALTAVVSMGFGGR